ncbi:hypothetical protein [Orenia marismortui]|uniref:Uncharacterized protein n=1 Tax=Orenia marismortui TaxID=46469 RepID=A0A4R8H222_9FIRM|nr:hypothetical protein [Orenia marismortui]TDX49124.1 hypothetical protein C7959_12018 [Orenia marismortui]
MEIRLEPCYPDDQNREEQIEYMVGEYEEVQEAVGPGDIASEYLDVAQVTVGLIDIEGGHIPLFKIDKEEAIANIRRKRISITLNIKRFRINRGNYKFAIFLIQKCLEMAYWICYENNISFESLLNDHKKKLESRRREWEEINDG